MRFSRASLPLYAVFAVFFAVLFSSSAFAVAPDRISGEIDASQMVSLRGNVHRLVGSEFDQGRADGAKLMGGVSLVFKPSARQQADLNKLLTQQQNPASPNYHQWLTPAQFADRFGVSQNDVQKVVSWLQGQGFKAIKVANSRNQIFFEGAVSQIEFVFHTEIHNYLVQGDLHYANATEPSVPAALAPSVLELRNLHNFQPRPRAQFRHASGDVARPNFTSHVSGNHFLAPGDFATIYDVQALYNANVDGSGQTIAIVGQSAINLTDISNFRSAAGLSAKAPTLLLQPSTGTSTVCSGDEGESDLDLEWSGGVAKNATIVFVYAGLATGDTCTNRTFGAFDALQYAVDQNLAPVISISYGNCEANITLAGAQTMQGWAQQANTQGQTIIAASGDSGAADCDFQVPSAALGLAVDIPAAIPEVTGAGGTEFTGDAAATVTNGNAGATTYWSGTTGGTDTLSSALSYIPEMGWNDSTADIAASGNISASGGGKSTFFTKPTWQTGMGVPSDGQRDVPDIALSASADHDGYLVCSEDGATLPSCSSGFRDSTQALSVVGGTSAAAPTFAGIVALVNQYLVTNGFQTAAGVGNANPNLYHIATYNSAAFNDVTTGNNIVPCTKGTTSCPTSGSFGFSAGAGYDQVTGLGSIKANTLAKAWGDLLTPSTISILPSSTQIFIGASDTFTVTVTPSSASGTVSFFNNGSTTALGTATVTAGTATFTTTSLPSGADSVTATYSGTNANSSSSAVSVSVIAPNIQLSPSVATVTAVQGQTTGPLTLTVTSSNGFVVTSGGNSTTALPLTYSCSNLPSEATCNFSPSSTTSGVTVTLNIATTASTAQMRAPIRHSMRVFYAVLLPGLLGIFLCGGLGKHAGSHTRLLGLIAILGFSTLWLGACGNNATSSNGNPGTPRGTYTVTIKAATGATTGSTTVQLQVN